MKKILTGLILSLAFLACVTDESELRYLEQEGVITSPELVADAGTPPSVQRPPCEGSDCWDPPVPPAAPAPVESLAPSAPSIVEPPCPNPAPNFCDTEGGGGGGSGGGGGGGGSGGGGGGGGGCDLQPSDCTGGSQPNYYTCSCVVPPGGICMMFDGDGDGVYHACHVDTAGCCECDHPDEGYRRYC